MSKLAPETTAYGQAAQHLDRISVEYADELSKMARATIEGAAGLLYEAHMAQLVAESTRDAKIDRMARALFDCNYNFSPLIPTTKWEEFEHRSLYQSLADAALTALENPDEE